ncbi:MAG: tetratricopeptide repeat protein [Desulfuromonadales bacterium]|nr:tetratricopeptide repeat protein [Desulfuromonadales bacterium]
MTMLDWIGEKAIAFEKCNSKRNVIVLCIALVVITLAVYFQVGDHPFSTFDDPSYVTDNVHISSGITGKNISWAFSSVEAANWHPITWLSHMTDAQIYGLNPRGHHLTNVLIHSISTVLLIFLLLRLTGSLWQSIFVAALFALHPLHVESVAWVAERKDVLSAFFWFVSLLFYAEYVVKHRPASYIFSLISFMLGLMSKPMLVTLPLVMLLIDFWPFDRYVHEEHKQGQRQHFVIISLIKEKIPFFACSLISGIVTIYAQHEGGAVSSFESISLIYRIENAMIAYVKYIGKTVWPHDLAVLYPLPSEFQFWQIICSLSFLLLVSIAVIATRLRFPYLLVGWFWFIVTLLPVIGLIQVGSQSMADRYSYIPSIGLFIIAAWGVPDLIRGMQHRDGILALVGSAVIFASVVLTWQQLRYWRDSISLYQHSLQVAPGSYSVHYNLGLALAEKGNLNAAIHQYHEAIRIRPNHPDSHGSLGLALAEKGDLDAAIRECQVALQLSPNDAKAHYNLGFTLDMNGNLEAAIREYQEAIRISPNNLKAHNNLGVALVRKGDLDSAIREYKVALQINPDDTKTHYNLGRVYAKKGYLDAAIHEFQVTLRISPNFKDAYINMADALLSKGDLDSAIREYQNALRLSPNDIDAHCNLGVVLAKKGDLDAAIQEFQNVLRISPNDTYAQNNLGLALAKKKR